MPKKLPKNPIFEGIEEASNLLKFLSHPLRLKILCLLSEGAKTVSDLQSATGGSQVQISQFLALMKARGLVMAERQGAFISYSLSDTRIQSIISALEDIFCK